MTRRRKVALVVVALGFAFLSVSFVRGLNRARRSARQTMCVHNLKVIGLQLRMYAEAHDGAFPDTWSTLVADPEFGASDILDIFVCPNLSRGYKRTHGVPSGPEDIDELSSYVLVGGLPMTDDKDTIIAYEKGDNHGGIGHSVLYLDTRGGWDPPSNWR